MINQNQYSYLWADRLGTCASSLCAVHCLLMPVLITILPTIGVGFLASSKFEWMMIAIASFFGVFACIQGFKKHQRAITFILLIAGIAILLCSRLAHAGSTEACCAIHTSTASTYPMHSILSVCGGILLASSHLFNLRFCKQCGQCVN